jgi:glutathione S-transferase
MAARLYSLSLSHPSQAARLMLEQKQIDCEIVDLLPGLHPVQLRIAGFRGGTVPALRLDGRRVQGSRRISRFLDDLRAEPRLFPEDPERRRAVEQAEEWGERELQPVPRRMFRWALGRRRDLREWMVREIVGWPGPAIVAALNGPQARYFARLSGATDAQIRADIAALPGQLDHVDALIAEGTIGGDVPNAADLQIGTTVRVLTAYPDLAPLLEGRPAEAHARRILPELPGPVPPLLPAGWA